MTTLRSVLIAGLPGHFGTWLAERLPGTSVQVAFSAAEVYAQIVSDLQDAMAKLPATVAQPGRATKGAAEFLLGRTYLLTKDYPKAIAALTDVVGTSGTSPYGYRLLPNYRDVFDPANTNNAESIFELQFGAGIAGQPHTGIVAELLPYNSRGRIVATTVTPSGDQLVSAQALEWYETGDARKDASIQFWRDPAVDSLKAYLAKFVWPSAVNTQGQQAGNIIVFRYAEGTHPNGAMNDIAGIANKQGKVIGMMPHPENMIEPLHGNSDCRPLFESLLAA
jgi:hypothetical protein